MTDHLAIYKKLSKQDAIVTPIRITKRAKYKGQYMTDIYYDQNIQSPDEKRIGLLIKIPTTDLLDQDPVLIHYRDSYYLIEKIRKRPTRSGSLHALAHHMWYKGEGLVVMAKPPYYASNGKICVSNARIALDWVKEHECS